MSSKIISFEIDSQQFNCYFSYPEGAQGLPAVMVLPEWWGLNDYPRQRADMLADMGYVALAVDLYGDGKTADDPTEAAALMNAAMSKTNAIMERFLIAMKMLQNQPEADRNQISVIGYCFGGAVALNMARSGLKLRSVASFHGDLRSEVDTRAGQIRAKIKVFHGNDDKMISAESVAEFQEEMAAAEADCEFVGYEGAEHGFSNPAADEKKAKFGIDVAYNKAADEDSWQRLSDFLQETLPK